MIFDEIICLGRLRGTIIEYGSMDLIYFLLGRDILLFGCMVWVILNIKESILLN